MYNMTICSVVDPRLDSKKKLYWAERDQQDGDYYNDGDYLRDYTQELDWAYEDRGVYGGGGLMKSLLECLVRDQNLEYFREYDESELWEEVADDWEGLRDYICWGDDDLKKAITAEAVKKAWEVGRKNEGTQEQIMSALLGREVYKVVCRGYNQGDYAEVYMLLDEADEDADEALRYYEELLNAYLFGSYSVLELVDDGGELMARGLVLDYTPRDLLGVKNRWEKIQERARMELLREALGDEDAEKIRDEIGRATARPYTAYNWEFEEPKKG